MGYVTALMLLLFSPASYQAATVDCCAIAEVYNEAVELGVITPEERDRLVARCIKHHGE